MLFPFLIRKDKIMNFSKTFYEYYKKIIITIYFVILMYYVFNNQWATFNAEIYFTTLFIIFIFIVGWHNFVKSNTKLTKENLDEDLTIEETIKISMDIIYTAILIFSNFGYFEPVNGSILLLAFVILKALLLNKK